MAKLSIIVCCYNTKEEYVDRCLTSISDNTYKDIEIVFVDDGSSLDYTKILRKFDNLKYIKTENQGTLAARMTGIKNASGDYITFVDSDDEMSFCYYEPMIKALETQKADICLNDWAFKTQSCAYYCNGDSTISGDLNLSNDEVLEKFFAQQGKEHSYYVLWNKIFSREVLLYAVSQIENLDISKLTFAEDVLLSYFAFSAAQKLINVHLGFYFYRIHGAQEINNSSQEKLKNHIESMALVFDVIEKDLKENQKFEKFEKDFSVWKNMLATIQYLSAKRSKFNELLPYIKENYNIEDIKKLPKDYDGAYKKQIVLPLNINQIDTSLKKVYYSNKYLKIFAKNNKYALASLEKMQKYLGKRLGLVLYKSQATFVFDKAKISPKQRILHNDFVQNVGKFLFPKGSKIRKFLKSKL